MSGDNGLSNLIQIIESLEINATILDNELRKDREIIVRLQRGEA